MIERYRRPEMAKVWEDRNRYLKWLLVEYEVCAELAKKKIIPPGDWKTLNSKLKTLIKNGGVEPKRVETFEKKTKHDVIAFTTAVAEKVGPTSRFVHYGLTSSDVLDTALSLQVQEACDILQNDIQSLMKELKALAKRYEKLPTIGRSHGIYAEPTSFGLKFLGWYTEWERNLVRFKAARESVRTGKLSGAVGVSPHWGPDFEQRVLSRLGLRRESVSTQVIPRDRHAEFFFALALCGSSLERMAVELRHLQRSEVAEVMEGFEKGQKGSSAMPHKRNPISAENLTGCARLLRSYLGPALENVALWHERDISHSSVERIVFPDGTILLNYALQRTIKLVKNLVVRKDRVEHNLGDAGQAVFSGHFLLALTEAGAKREEAYYWVQECAIASIEKKVDLTQTLEDHPKVSRFLSKKKIRELGSVNYQLRNVPKIYKTVLSKSK